MMQCRLLGMPTTRLLLALVVLVPAVQSASGSPPTCHTPRTCPKTCPEGREESFDAYVYRPSTPQVRNAIREVQSQMQGQEEVSMVENAGFIKVPLHHFCCHTAEEQTRIEKAVTTMGWAPIELGLQGFLCTSGEDHALHVGVTPASKKELTTLVRLIRHYAGVETGINEEGLQPIGPRIDAFRLRLATVTQNAPFAELQQVVEAAGLLGNVTVQFIQVGAITARAYNRPQKP